ncbi:MAG: hypothetical protein EAX95_00950 [Candidatus Thorarchaeota archaeon]|nr:hypothetical protein [Candidatus Thorarchaeota archaeon]
MGIRSFPRLTIPTVILLVGLFLFMSFFMSIRYYSPLGYHPWWMETKKGILSEESPIYAIEIPSSSTAVTIDSLQTNSTPVMLVVRGSQTQFNATNITSLTMFPITVARAEQGLLVEVIRQESDVNFTIAIHYQLEHITYPYTFAPPPTPILIPSVGTILIVFSLGGLYFPTSRFKYSRHERNLLQTAILLLLIGTGLCYPLGRGQVQGDFVPTATPVTLDENFSYMLNETSPVSFLDLSSLYPEEGTVTQYEIHSLYSDSYPILLRISCDNESELMFVEEGQNSNWWLTIPVDHANSTAISFERVDADAILSLSVRKYCRLLQIRAEITLPVLCFIIGAAAIMLGLALTLRVDLSLKLEEREPFGTSPITERGPHTLER